MPRSFVYILTIITCTVPLLFGQTGQGWEAAWNASSSSSSFVPSGLAREIVATELGARNGESETLHARRSFAAALDVERALRFGYTSQEARARLRQSLRLEASAGTEGGGRMAAKLAKVERKNSQSGKAGAVGTGSAIGTGSTGTGTGKGKNGQ
ncbi:MAG: hypothetical protein WCT14_00465 [Treponemataceae bacterium]